MKKVRFEFNDSDDFGGPVLADKLLSDEEVAAWLKDQSLSLEGLKDNPWLISDYIEEREKCRRCPGLGRCQRSPKGYSLGLEFVKGKPMEVLRLCRWQKKAADKYSHRRNYLVCYLSDRQLLNRFENIDTAREESRYLAIKDLIEEWNETGNWKGYYLHGDIGAGKTYLMSCLTNRLADQGKKVAFVNVPAFFADARNSIGYDDSFVENNLRKMKKAEVLVLDDIGAENATDWVRDDLLMPLLEYRMENRLPTFFTSNLNPDDLKTHYTYTSSGTDKLKAARIMERIRTLSYPVSLKGQSRR